MDRRFDIGRILRFSHFKSLRLVAEKVENTRQNKLNKQWLEMYSSCFLIASQTSMHQFLCAFCRNRRA